METIAEERTAHDENNKEAALISPAKKVARQSTTDRTARKSRISSGRRSSFVKEAVGAHPNMKLLAEHCPEVADRIERLEAYRKSLLDEREASIQLIAKAKAEYDQSLRDAERPSEFDIGDLPFNQRSSILQGSLNYDSILQTLLQHRQMTNAFGRAVLQSAHKEAVEVDQQLRLLNIEVQDRMERWKAGR